MKKEYTSAPLPFQGQKRWFVKEFRQVMLDCQDDITVIDLFGGSGLLSHIAKQVKPHARVIYNDYDNYHLRLNNIARINEILRDFRVILRDVPRHEIIPRESGYVDYVTLSSSLLFSMQYATNVDELKRKRMYNNVRLTDYAEGGGILLGLK